MACEGETRVRLDESDRQSGGEAGEGHVEHDAAERESTTGGPLEVGLCIDDGACICGCMRGGGRVPPVLGEPGAEALDEEVAEARGDGVGDAVEHGLRELVRDRALHDLAAALVAHNDAAVGRKKLGLLASEHHTAVDPH